MVLLFSGCEENLATTVTLGRASLSVTDAPIDDESITGVWITIAEVHFQTVDEVMHTYPGNLPDEPINLMNYSGGKTLNIGTEVAVPAGDYNQIRFVLEIEGEGEDETTDPGSFVSIDDNADPLTEDIKVSLKVPSGDTSGYKAEGLFSVQPGDTTKLAVDFDLRQSVLRIGSPSSPSYLLKPIIRLIVADEAGWIDGLVVPDDVPANAVSVVAYAYADDTWSDEEASDLDFENSIASDRVDFINFDPAEKSYTLAFLPAGIYDVAVAIFDEEGDFLEMWGFYSNAVVTAEQGTHVEISNANLSAALD